MKKQTALHTLILKMSAGLLTAGVLLISCQGTNEVVPSSCLDQKDYNSDFAKELNGISHYIPVEQGIKLVDNFARYKDSAIRGGQQFKSGDPGFFADYETFNLKAIDSLLCQQEAIGFRVYSGLDENNKMRFVLVGVNKDGTDVLQRKGNTKGANILQPLSGTAGVTGIASGDDLVLESGQRHP